MSGELEAHFDDSVVRRMAVAIEPQLRPGESLEDVIAGAKYLATERAHLLGRRVITDIDLTYIVEVFTWWPFKPHLPDGLERELHRIRRVIFHGAADGHLSRLMAAVPRATLVLEVEGLRALQVRGDVEDLLRPPPYG